jgi:hypothetical protein
VPQAAFHRGAAAARLRRRGAAEAEPQQADSSSLRLRCRWRLLRRAFAGGAPPSTGGESLLLRLPAPARQVAGLRQRAARAAGEPALALRRRLRR